MHVNLKPLVLVSSIVTFVSVSYYVVRITRYDLPIHSTYNNAGRRSDLKNLPQRHANAFILTSSCTSIRYNTTLKNLERSFPNFFRFYCYLSLPLNDSHIHTSNVLLFKKFSSALVSTVQIWTYEIPKYASDELEWSFFFEDDVNIIDPKTASPVISSWFNYTPILQELMHDLEVQEEHGFFYLGICGPKFNFTHRPLRASTSVVNDTLFHYKGYGLCGHALAFTTKRARLFWTEISTYRPASAEAGADRYIRDYCVRSGSNFYTLGANKHWPPKPEHRGLVFQDRGVFSTTIH
jgi:hypothetical protein